MRTARRTALLFFDILSFLAPASGQPVVQTFVGVKFCQILKDDTQRLKCFDELFAEKPKEESTTKETAGWDLDESKSPLDGSPQISAGLKAVDGDTLLILRCTEKKTEAVFGGPLMVFGSDPIKVLVRVGDGKLIETHWAASPNGRSAFAPSAIQFIQSLPENGKLFLRAFNFRGNGTDGEFDLGNVTAVRDKIAVACNWIKPTNSAKPK
jgi:hypothetical protein